MKVADKKPVGQRQHGRTVRMRQRIESIQMMLAKGIEVDVIRQYAMARWKVGRHHANRYLRLAHAASAEALMPLRQEALRQAWLRYSDALAQVYKLIENGRRREKVVETPGPDGKPVRRVEVVREDGMTAAAVRLLLEATRRVDKMQGVEGLPAHEAPIGIDVKFPVWSEGPGEGLGPDPVPPTAPEPTDDPSI